MRSTFSQNQFTRPRQNCLIEYPRGTLRVSVASSVVPRIRARFGRAPGATAVLLCVALFLAAFGIPRATGLLDETGWVGVLLFGVGALCVEIPRYRHRATELARARQARFDRSEVFRDDDLFDSPEGAALAGWAPAAQARVLETHYVNERKAEVLVDTVPSHPMSVEVERSDRGWFWTCDLNT